MSTWSQRAHAPLTLAAPTAAHRPAPTFRQALADLNRESAARRQRKRLAAQRDELLRATAAAGVDAIRQQLHAAAQRRAAQQRERDERDERLDARLREAWMLAATYRD